MATSTAFSAVNYDPARSHAIPNGGSFTNSSIQAIDLTGDDDDDDDDMDMDEVDTSAVDARNSKRPRFDSYNSQTPNSYTSSDGHQPQPQTPRDRFRAEFASKSSAFFPNRIMPGVPPPIHHSASLPNLHHPRPQLSQAKVKSRRGHVRQVIDLTSSPSPPPAPSQHSHPSHYPGYPRPGHPQYSQSSLSNQIPEEVSLRTPVCIGQLTVTALILYPTTYVNFHPPGAPTTPDHPDNNEYAPVRLTYDLEAKQRSPNAEETINITTPPYKVGDGPNDPVHGGSVFGVVEQKAATVLGPMLGKGLIKMDAKIRRGAANMPILNLYLLLFTPKGNIHIVSQYLQNSRLMLDHPAPPFDLNTPLLVGVFYSNPHNPPPGGFGQSGAFARPLYGVPGRTAWGGSRWSGVAPNAKNVEVQRSQVDEVFKNLKSGDELEETEAPFEIQTSLYPHQKKALTFLLDREGEISGEKRDPSAKEPQPLRSRWEVGSSSSSLWTVRRTPSGALSWLHAVTNREVFEEPRECKAALLADDMGLGKTITCASLVASTLPAARVFGNSGLDPLPPLPKTEFTPSSGSFGGVVWGMPDGGGVSSKSKGKGKMEERRGVEEYARACRLKVKSRGTLIVCPLSTVSNWEDQFKEHWGGEVVVVGGNGGASGSCTTPQKKPGTSPIRVYVYHGIARTPDPMFLADFDAVITTFATLASEFSKQARSGCNGEEDEDEYSEAEMEEVMNNGFGVPSPLKKTKSKTGMKRKKGGGPEQSSPLQMVHWFRVVLDEAHCIKETSTVGSRASCDLIADRRLCLTGTPVQNKLDDIFALIKFLRLEPFDDKAVWTEYVGGPVKFGQELGIARLQTIMKCITLRRTKESKAADGTNILSLPPRNERHSYLKFNEKEKEIYQKFFSESKAEFNQMSEKNEVMKNYVGILQKILRLRQICDHYELVKGKGILAEEEETVNYDEIVAQIAKEGINFQRGMVIFSLLRESGTAQCVECGIELAPPLDDVKEEGVDDETVPKRGRKAKTTAASSRGPTRQNSPTTPRPILTRCQHLFCIECFRNCVCPGWPNVPSDICRGCSTCQAGLSPSDVVELSTEAPQNDVKKKPGKREKRQKFQLENRSFSTKIDTLVVDLLQFSRRNPHSLNYDPDAPMEDDEGNPIGVDVVKSVVFSQWTSMLDKIEDALELAQIQYDRLDGTMKRDERSRAMDSLKYNPVCEVLLVSLKAGGVGLNLTAAQRVYLMDPYWNPAVENQAVDRIHRLGQTKPVQIIKYIIEGSVEQRLLDVQKRKTELANMTLSQNMSRSELHQRRMEELNQLFDV